MMEIRSIQLDDLPLRVAWMNTPEVYSSMHFDVPILMENTIKWFERNRDNDSRLDVTILEDGEIVAFGGFTAIDHKVRKAETYLFANPGLHHRGIGTRAKMMMCKYGFEDLGLNKLYFVANEDNYPILRVNEKCGFVQEGRLRQEYLTSEGEMKDMLYYGLLKEDWIKRNAL